MSLPCPHSHPPFYLHMLLKETHLILMEKNHLCYHGGKQKSNVVIFSCYSSFLFRGRAEWLQSNVCVVVTPAVKKKMFANNYIPAVAYKSLLLEGTQNSGETQYINCQNLNIGLYEERRINVCYPLSDKVCNNSTKGF